ncbi:VaFE repeat-containing surface-anchored protein, partial [Corynebacterium kefirresidentii]|uniref:VaFE repeat-containing surface-anchored protein n=1 Tax=Corynebacterium kefirresidentii TaxID=1979527 RepID=UPI001302C666
MSKLRNISREGWMVFTAVLAAIAVIAAMVTVPGAGAARAADDGRISVTPNEDLGPEHSKGGSDEDFAGLVWAGKPISTGFGQGNQKNNAGWGWCIDTLALDPMQNRYLYDKDQAGKASIPDGLHDAAINVAIKLRDATAKKDLAAASNYTVYLVALIGAPASRPAANLTITGEDPSYQDPFGKDNYPNFTGSEKEFKELTGLEIVDAQQVFADKAFKKDPNVEIPKYAPDAYITILGPDGDLNGKPNGQRVFTPDQPGLPEDGGSGSNPSTKTPSIKTEAKFAEGSSRVVNGAVVTDTVTYEGLVDGKNYHLDAKLMSKDGKTVLGTGSADFEADSSKGFTTVDIKVDNAEKPVDAAVAFEELTSTEVESNGDETPNNETPNKIAEHKDLNDGKQTVNSKKTLEPSIKTEAKFAEGSSRVVNGAVVTDTVTYEGLVDGKNYHLDAKLMSKDGKTVLGTGSADFEADSSKGFTTVDIKVDNAEKPVDAAVAFEELTSTEVESNGDETPNNETPNKIAEHK